MKNEVLDIIIPVILEAGGGNIASIEAEILELHQKYGFTRFALSAPGKGCRSTHYPARECFAEIAAQIEQIKNDLSPRGIDFGWWLLTTVKSGPSEEFDRPIRAGGEEAFYASCPADARFRRRLCEDLAFVARKAKPSFIITEDDFSVHAATFTDGCFCRHHLDGFAEREGKRYSREELLAIFETRTPEAIELLRRWRAWTGETLVTLAREMREALDVNSPEIPLGCMQTGGDDRDGNCTEAVARAMAGARHVPFSRLYGTFYNGGDTKDIPKTIYHALYTKQHMPAPFRFYHESDSYPHVRYFTSASQMRALMAIAYASGFDGSTFQVQQHLDNPNEEYAYGRMFLRARPRMEELHRVAKQCVARGVEIAYDPFINTVDTACSQTEPLWAKPIGLFGIPYVTTAQDVAFWDARQAKYADDATVRAYLSKGLFLDGEAARALCERGYGEYLGVTVGENVAQGPYRFDLGAKDVIRAAYVEEDSGRCMAPGHTYACGREGKLLRITVTDPRCEVLSEEFTFEDHLVSASMTRFENALGGRVTVMGVVLDGNGSSSLYNYRRQRLLQRLVTDCTDAYACVKDAPATYLLMNEATDAVTSGFLGMLTLINLCDDPAEGFSLRLPAAWRAAKDFFLLASDGTWKPLACTRTDDGIRVEETLHYCDPLAILIV